MHMSFGDLVSFVHAIAWPGVVVALAVITVTKFPGSCGRRSRVAQPQDDLVKAH